MREENAPTETEESQGGRGVVSPVEFAARSFAYLFRICGVSFSLCMLIFVFMRINGWKLRISFEMPKGTLGTDYHAKEKG